MYKRCVNKGINKYVMYVCKRNKIYKKINKKKIVTITRRVREIVRVHRTVLRTQVIIHTK